MLYKALTVERMNDSLCVCCARACRVTVHITAVINGDTSLFKFIYLYQKFDSWSTYFYLRSCSAFITFLLLFLWLYFHPFKT